LSNFTRVQILDDGYDARDPPVWSLRGRELVENSAKTSGHGVDFGVGQKLPVSNARDRFLKEVGGKQAPLRDVFGCHALVVPCSPSPAAPPKLQERSIDVMRAALEPD
jgi:hypothetical protein